MFFFKGPKGLLNFKARVGLSFDFVPSVPDLLFGHVNLLSKLHDNSRMIKHMHVNK